MGDGARTGEKAASDVGEGDLEVCLEALGFDFDRRDSDTLSAGNGGVIFSSVIVGLHLSAGVARWRGFAVLREFAGSCKVPVSPVFFLCLRLDNVAEVVGGFLEALLLLLLLMNPSNKGILFFFYFFLFFFCFVFLFIFFILPSCNGS